MTRPERQLKGTKSRRMNKQNNTKNNQNQIQKAFQKQEHRLVVYPTALSILVFLIVFTLSYLAWIPPHFSHHAMHTHPHSFSTLTRSLTAVEAPWKCMEMDPSFVCPETGLLLESEPCLKSEVEDGWRKMRVWQSKREKRKLARISINFFLDWVCILYF